VAAGKGTNQNVVKATKASSAGNRAFFGILGAVAVLGIATLTYLSSRPKELTNVSPIDSTLPPVQSAGYVIGSASAPIEVTEFGDFECPACGQFAVVTEPDIRKNFVETGKIRWRFIDFPLSVHRNTWPASRAAACADEQGKFWQFHDALYMSQDQWSGETTDKPDAVMKQLAAQLGLNTSQFDQCVDSKKTQAKVQAHYALAVQRRVDQTPSFIIGDQLIGGAVSYDELAKYLNDALAKATPATPSSPTSTKAK
jgi:protein-disulfide isomerase